MAAPDGPRLEGMLAVVQRRQDGMSDTSGTRSDGATVLALPEPDPEPPRPPTGPGSPRVKGARERGVRGHANGADTQHAVAAGTLLTLPRVPTHPEGPLTAAPAARPAAARARTGRVKKGRVRTPSAATASREVEARAAWERGARTVGTMRFHTGMSKTAAASWVRMLKAETRAGGMASTAAR